jgi:hypothetical protein
MDQVKEFLRQAIKHRFWIAVGISALLPMIAYAVGSGPIRDEAKKRTDEIDKAEKGVEKYKRKGVTNGQYKPIVDEKKAELAKDVDASWRKLYARQERLLDWPKNVQDRFRKWGRKWPENEDPSAVELAIIQYEQDYPAFVTKVYQTFHPFDPIEGTGIVAAPSETQLLTPLTFKEQDHPSLGTVWSAQERLWAQRALLSVVADVNRNAKDWDSATIKQVNSIDVGTSTAQDQVSLGQGVALDEAPDLAAPDSGQAAAPAAAGGAGNLASLGIVIPKAGPTAGSSGGFGPADGGASTKKGAVYYIHSDSSQFKTLPVSMSVMMKQEAMSDFLIALENSPLAIQVPDCEMAKPSVRIVKPIKGGPMMNFGGGMMAGFGGLGGPMMRPRVMFGGPIQIQGPMASTSSPGGGYGSHIKVEARKGVDKRNTLESRSEKAKKDAAQYEKAKVPSIHDPFFYIVQVTIYGQARFYNPPPPLPAAEPSQSAGMPAPAAEAAKPAAPPAKAAKPAAPPAAPAAKKAAD